MRSESVREQHGRGEGRRDCLPPDLVVYPMSTEEVSQIVRAAADAGSPIIAYGAGSSLEGHVAAPYGGVCIDMARMNRVLRYSVVDMDAKVEAGVTRTQLTKELAGSGATFFIDPGADASIGGMIATGASGTTSVRYGTMRENVLGLTVVMADGRIMHTGSRARKSAAGYDLTRLLIGSEGTLGVVTEATVRLHPMPDAIAAAICRFESVEQAVDVVVALLQCGVPLARIELLDALTAKSLNDFLDAGLPVAPLIFLEIHAFSAAASAEQLAVVREVVADGGGAIHATATSESDRSRLWEARHRVYYAGLAMQPGGDVLSTDACVPISALAECIRETRDDVEREGVMAPLVGHVGDGNFHLLLLTKLSDDVELARAHGIISRLADRAVRLGGSCTGELRVAAAWGDRTLPHRIRAPLSRVGIAVLSTQDGYDVPSNHAAAPRGSLFSMSLHSLFPSGWQSFLTGGLLIGAGVSLLFVMTGLIGGMSTVFSSTWSFFSRATYFQQERFASSRTWRLVFASGLVLGAFAWRALLVPGTDVVTIVPWWRLLAGGLLVGYGARLSNGCTSGHGICGLASLQLPSLLAVLTFLATAMATAHLATRVLAP